jgi:hypothetical protein
MSLKPPLNSKEDFDDFLQGFKTLIKSNGRNLYYDQVSEMARMSYLFAYSKKIERRMAAKIKKEEM